MSDSRCAVMNACSVGSIVAALGLVALERLDRQREPGRVGEQTDGDLWFQTAFFGEPGLAEPAALIGFEVERGYVIKHQRRRPERRVRGAAAEMSLRRY